MNKAIIVNLGLHNRVFENWVEFADYIKQENLADRVVTILSWRYI